MAINNPVITDSDWLQATAVAIQNKDGGGKIEVPDFASRVEAIPTGSTGGRIIYSNFDSDGLPHTMEYVPLSVNDTKLPNRFISFGHAYTLVTWNSRIENIICPNHITELGVGGFSVGGNNKKLSNYDSLKIVGANAFNGQLGTWNYDHLPPNLEYIDSDAFIRAPFTHPYTARFQIPDSVYYIGQNAFQYMNIGRAPEHYLLLPSSLKYLGNTAFYQNGYQSFPMEIIIPPLVETIGNNVFGGSAYLTTTITFQGTPQSISSTAFATANNTASMRDLVTINVPWSEGEVANAPWGAVNATINYNYTG